MRRQLLQAMLAFQIEMLGFLLIRKTLILTWVESPQQRAPFAAMLQGFFFDF